ncbi:MAG: hypothetical protein Q4G68_14880 [Planctomycetia bacterium]|nr:hypothetical protein [Planctomycetia bacterium]
MIPTVPTNYDVDDLFQCYINRTLNAEQARALLTWVRANSDNEQLFAKSVMGDFLLTERSFLIRDDRTSLNQDDIAPQGFRWSSLEEHKARREEDQAAMTTLDSVQNCEKVNGRVKNTFHKRRKRQSLWPILTALAALLLLLTPFIRHLWPTREPFCEFAPPRVARVLELIDPVWQDDCPPLIRGQETENRRIALKSGLVNLEFASGARAILEGPSDLLLQEDKNPFCSQGKLSVHVPPHAVGFTIDTQFGKVIDRGTNFFVHVTPTQTNVGVDKGKIDFNQGESTPVISLTRQQAIEIGTDAQARPITYNPKNYYAESALNERVDEQVRLQLSQKEEEDRDLNADPNLLVRYDFLQSGKENVRNRAEAGQHLVGDPLLTAIRNGSGPLRGTKGILLRDRNSSITLTLPDELKNITIETTLRIDRLNSGSNVLLASESYTTTNGSILWQILASGEMQLHYRVNGQTDYYATPGVVARGRIGTWMTLAVTLDARRRLITFKADGRELSRHNWKNAGQVHLGRTMLGNIPQELHRNEPRLLNGGLCDLKIFTIRDESRVTPSTQRRTK